MGPGQDRTGWPVKILLIEDDAETAAYVRKGLREQGHTVDHAADGRDGLFLAAGGPYDVMIIDRMLPELDGLAIVKTLRGAGVKSPILFLTTMSGVADLLSYLPQNTMEEPPPARGADPVTRDCVAAAAAVPCAMAMEK